MQVVALPASAQTGATRAQADTLHPQADSSRFTNLGPQLRASMIQGSLFVKDSAGRELLYTVVRGEPAHLLGYELASGKLLLDQPLPGADGAWDMAYSPDGWLYVPGASGSLFRHRPGSPSVENLGQALQGETYVWSLTTGKNGEIFGATYPGCRVFRYHPKDGFSDAGRGPLVAGENYVRSLAFHEKSGKLYAGVGSHAHLVELDPVTGQKKEILPAKYKNREFVYGLELVTGIKGGDRLMALLNSGQTTIIYNLRTHKVEAELDSIDMKTVLQQPGTPWVYVTSGGKLCRLDISRPTAPLQVIGETGASANALALSGDKQVQVLTYKGVVHRFHPATRVSSQQQLEIPGQPIPIQSIIYGPDDRIWMGGYLAGGHATYDPQTGASQEYKGHDQTEGMAVQGDHIYMGIYPHGKLYALDTRQPWDAKTNPAYLGSIPGQSRAFAILAVEEKKKVFFGTVPEYGQLGGALIAWDRQANTLDAVVNIVPNQSVVSLAQAGGLLYLGTSISGGLGAQASEKEARLVAWDMDRKQKLMDIAPVPGAMAITALINGPGNTLWGMADGQLFIFDPVKKAVIATRRVHEVPATRGHIWRSAFLGIHPSGTIYGTGANLLFSIDPASLAVTILDKKASLFAMDKQGYIYFKRNTELWRYQPE
ncbi:hypothetical protein BC349_10135 [Flavihumibacter stibioxidans]|uniref:Uncharacterized protein n=1 Tax=Flavihumibacter stibioxidans TaxID=1834163 RepID=A0ABR7M8T9_9BACT|nr:hypothetical protein [Flavihumibacter stibioxidans]